MAQATPYSYTERKRIRKSFGKREHVLDVPYLLTMQREAYVAFLQKDVPPSKRKPEGLQAAFLSAFPIVSHNSMVEMKFIEYNIAKPPFDVRECQQRGLTFAAAVRAKLAAEYTYNVASPFLAAERGELDGIIEPSATRIQVIKALRALRTKRSNLPPKKHGNIPL